jgi:hypothetical protein
MGTLDEMTLRWMTLRHPCFRTDISTAQACKIVYK